MEYRTKFVDAALVKNKVTFGMSIQDPNVDQMARDVEAALLEQALEGYELFQSIPVTSSMVYASAYPYSFTSGLLLIFKQKDQ